ncbi:hypothetical protein PUMCH_000930 [Australozyma saopauloensis]|uniref:U3 small nucleolar RNA-associated protein 18 n=1 Tax=Australozyma saopauloensis TaxID=291208 RepID=A0AAX4H5F9_9ASCO|nr:hypothetical protein PUMCH_000930 [[Candida] saopauloensis]
MDVDEKTIPPKDEEELLLEKLVFGDEAGFEANLRKIENLYNYSDEEPEAYDDISEDDSEAELDAANDEDLFFIDESGDANTETPASGDAMDVDGESTDGVFHGEDAAWNDSDDENAAVTLDLVRTKGLRVAPSETALAGESYIARLRSQYEKIYPRPEWTETWDNADETEEADNFDDEAEEDSSVGTNTSALTALLNRTTTFSKKTTKLLPPNTLNILRLKDANIARRARSGIQSMAFHPSHPLLLTGGFDRTLRIYHIDGKANRFVSLVHFRDMPITTCLFVSGQDSNLVYAAGRRRYMHRWDIATGEVEKILRMYGQDKLQKSFEYFKISPKGTTIALRGESGWVNTVSGTTGQFVKGYKVDGHVADFAYTHDESTLIVANNSGTIWEFDCTSASTSAIRKWTDVGAVAVSKIALGGAGDRWLAVGTKSGIVNLFDRLSCYTIGDQPKPFKEVGNLVTEVTGLTFAPDGQILCISSLQKKDALKLVHLPLGTVFANWPTSGTPLGRVTIAEFSPDNQMLAIGSDNGKITLWRLNHY